MVKKTLLIFFIFFLGLGMVNAEVLDYDTFDREDGSLGVTEGQGNIYHDVDPIGSINEIQIVNNEAVINLTPLSYEYYQIAVNFSDTPVSEFTIYFKVKSNTDTEFLEIGAMQLTGTNVDDALYSSYYSTPNFWETGNGVNTTVPLDEYIEIYMYKNDVTNVLNYTWSYGGETLTSSTTSARDDFGRMFVYFESAFDDTGANETVMFLDEWAVCSGYDLSCSIPVVEEEDTGYEPDYTSGDLVEASIDSIVAFIISIGLFIGLIAILFIVSWGTKIIKR